MSTPSPSGPGSNPGPDEPSPDTPSPTSPGLGDDNPYTPLSGGQRGVSTRYWDCCKQGCSWTGKQGTPVDSCNLSGQNVGVNDQVRSACDGGDGQTCHGMAPWAYSSQVAYGYAAVNAASCGSCWQLQFTGSSQSAGSDPGSQAIAGKTMIVMATNTGDIGAHHFDILIPGGGWGQNEGCARSLGIQNLSELGSQRGGMLTACAGAGSHDAEKQCVRDMCTRAFGSRGLSDLEAGCLWFVDWFQVADNPDFEYKQIDCPSELREFN